jgi:MazG family protein
MNSSVCATLEQLQKLVEASYSADAGCAWLKQQDMRSIANYSLEEVYELIAAIDSEDNQAICDELADLCYHLMIYAELGRQSDRFTLHDILQRAITKINSRKDFAAIQDLNADQVHRHWLQQKSTNRDQDKSALDNVPQALPAILRARKLQESAAAVGFDWNKASEVMQKLDEEVRELQQGIQNNNKEEMLDELGDVIFTAINLARHLNIDPEHALMHANQKFTNRFARVEQLAGEQGLSLNESTIEVLEKLWQAAKASSRH